MTFRTDADIEILRQVDKRLQDDWSVFVAANPAIPEHDKYYWGYQYQLAREVLVKQLVADGALRAGASVAEIGCAEGGVLIACVQAGAVRALGTDIESARLSAGATIVRTINTALASKATSNMHPALEERVTFSAHDILFDEPRAEWLGAFDLVILRDVLEHLANPTLALANIQRVLKPNGYVLVEFPPYNSPFGGHQHLLGNRWGKLPYMHLLPEPLFRWMTASGTHLLNIEEVRRLRSVRLTPRKFCKAAQEAGYTLRAERYYLLRPVFKMKFGLPTVSLTPLKWLPGVKSLLSLEANYLLQSHR
jgi:SAM-dependent methyltransferase